ncbi:MAG TPA: N-acetylmuramoyl-L-alanine amidase [Candidatus Polarisedimenticolaceae bacterium]|nr:N-acetylmuramoyl-L-alanine amidase [Candidatus Polarisedimenticolaceae bacterium]
MTARRRLARRWLFGLLSCCAAISSVLDTGGAGFTAVCAQDEAPRPDTLSLSSDLRVRVLRGRDVELEVRAAYGDDWRTIAERVSAAAGATAALAAWNGGEVTPERWLRVPLSLLNDDYRALVLVSLFPEDRRDGSDWVHLARSGRLPTYDAGLWQVAEWFAGDGDAFGELLAANRLGSPELRQGQAVRIPGSLLHPAFRGGDPATDTELEFERDEHGPYAAYRLKRGEALYSAVVVRYTGRTKASDVVTAAELIKERSGIRDLRDIPVGFKIKIPFELLEPQFLPPTDPRRIASEAERREVEEAMARIPRGDGHGLDGVVIILDPGHGGRDLGTMNNGIWEHDYVYDVTCRLKRRLEQYTVGRVYLTLVDEETGCAPSEADRLHANRQGTVQTDPPFLARENGEAKIGVNLRWYLANSIYRREVAAGVDPGKILFLSLHADARHPSLGGVMVYVPGAANVGETHGFGSKTYTRYAEVREQQWIKLTKKERIRSEAASLRLAEGIVDAFRALDLPVQPYQPVRNRIIRGRSTFVPAVLRGNVVPAKVLVEMVNLSNGDDAALLARAADRERLAEALHRALVEHFGADR